MMLKILTEQEVMSLYSAKPLGQIYVTQLNSTKLLSAVMSVWHINASNYETPLTMLLSLHLCVQSESQKVGSH